MLLTLLQFFASKFLVLALHLEAGSFPRPLSPQEEIRAFLRTSFLEEDIKIILMLLFYHHTSCQRFLPGT